MKRKKALLIVTGALTVLLCAALCASVLALYTGGMARRAETGSAAAPIFTREAVGRQLAAISPLAVLWLASAIAAGISGRAASGREKSPPQTEQLLGKAVRETHPPAARASMTGSPETAGRRALRTVLYAAAALLIVLGVLNGGLNDVLVKAINICTECIGLG